MSRGSAGEYKADVQELSRGSAGEYQADEQAGVARLRWRVSSVPESERSPGEGNGTPLQCSCLGNPIDRGAWWATVHGIAKESDMT